MSSAPSGFEFGEPAPKATGPAAPRLYTVTQLTALIKRVLGDHLPGTLHVVGEISNLSRPTSGHVYLTLKDNDCEVRAVMWKSTAAQLKFKLTDGLEVVAAGYIDVYPSRGTYQFYISRLDPRGVGALELAFRQLHEKLAREGLFDPRHKRPIPRFPRTIAVVTSPTGAAIRDILQTLRRRYCCVSIIFHPVRVQGEGAAAEIAAAITRLNEHAARLGGIDVMIVGRGGGSLEDLWAFNEEVVARAIHASAIPIISGVGHEVDTTIADLVADLRAPTPTAAAELACPLLDEILQTLTEGRLRLERCVRQRLERYRSELAAIERIEWFRDPGTLLRRAEQQLDEMLARLQYCAARQVSGYRERLHDAHVRITARQPATIIQRAREQLQHAVSHLRWALATRLQGFQRSRERNHQRLRAHWPAARINTEAALLEREKRRLSAALAHHLKLETRSIGSFAARLDATSHRRTLARGFTITRNRKSGAIITTSAQALPGEIIITETMDGSFESRVRDRQQPELFD